VSPAQRAHDIACIDMLERLKKFSNREKKVEPLPSDEWKDPGPQEHHRGDDDDLTDCVNE
jgi:hypothetical protein